MAGLAEEDGVDDKKGPVVYQEQKCFHNEWSIINVYDNQEIKRVTFEVYGTDTSEILRVVYNYVEFDAFFRFNAELMNPNRREGRYHWIMERLEVQSDGAGGRKVGLATDPTMEIPEKPLYEKRKIPTGRMNYQERQRLRESMDQLDIKRAEAISKKRAVAKTKFLVKIQEQKEEYQTRLAARTEKIAKEREERWAVKEQERQEEVEAHMEIEARNQVRLENVVAKEEFTEERDAQEIKDIHARYKAKEAIRQQEIKEYREDRKNKRVEAETKQSATKKKIEDNSGKREEAWRQRQLIVQKKGDEWLKAVKQEAELKRRAEQLAAEKKLVFIKDLHVERQKVFTEQNQRSKKRAQEIQETIKMVEEEHAAPPPKAAEGDEAEPAKEGEETKKRESSSKSPGKKAGKGEKKEKKEKKADGVIIDGVEGRMRAELEKQRQLAALEKIREQKFEDKRRAREVKAAEHAKMLRTQKRQAEEKERAAKDQKAVVVQQSKIEAQKELDRKQMDLQRKENLRNENIQRKLMAYMSTENCGKAFSMRQELEAQLEEEPVAQEA